MANLRNTVVTGSLRLASHGAGMVRTDANGTISTAAMTAGDLPSHNHDDRYYTESEINSLLSGKQDAATAITTSNIGSQSVNYANSAGTAGQVSGISVSSSQMQYLKNTLDSTSLPYTCDIYVDGDANTYYPVHFIWGDQDVWRRIVIKRGYSEEAPWDPVGTGVHHGGLLLDWEGNFGGWGGAEYSDRLRVFNESYTNVCADMFIYTHSMGYVFMLRGGHALYHISSDQPIRGYHQTGTPDIAYNTSTLFYDHSNVGYRVYAPAPVTSINSSRIDGLRTKKQSLFDGRYLQTLSVSGTNLSISGGNSVTLPTGGISQSTADGLYVKKNTWDGNLYLHTDGRIYGTIFYDANNDGYFVDPSNESKLYRLNVGGSSHTHENNEAVIKFKNTVDQHNYIVSESSSWNAWNQWIRYIGSYNTWRIGTYDEAQESGASVWRLAGRNRSSNGELNYIVAGPRGAWGSDDRVILYNPYARYDGGSYNGDGTHHALLPENKWWNSKYFSSNGDIYGTRFLDSNDGNYYVDPNSNSYLSRLRVADASNGVSLSVGNGSTHGVYTLDNARKYLVVAADYYPHMAIVASGSNNTTHGAVLSFVGSEGGSFRQWNLGISNNNPFLFSIGYNRTTDPNPHYGVGDGWSGDDNNHARLSIDRDGNTKIRGMLYVNGTSGGISTGSAVLHAGNYSSYALPLSGGTLSGNLNAWSGIVSLNRINFTTTAGSQASDPYCIRWIDENSARGAGLSWLEFQLNDDSNEEIRIYGNSCVGHGCGPISDNLYHRFRADGYAWHAGTLQADGDMRAPIFYDSNDTTYYGDFNGTSRFYQAIVFGDSSRYSAVSTTINGTGAGDKLIFYGNASNYDARVLVGTDYDFIFKSQGSPSNKGMFRFYSGNNASLALEIRADQNVYAPATVYAAAYRGNANVGGTGEATWHPAGAYIGSTMWQYGDMYKNNTPIYNLGYLGMTGGHNTPIDITGAAHKYVTINPGNGYEAMVRYIGGSGSSWYVGKRTSSQLIGTESFHLYSEAAGATVFGVNPSGVAIASGDMRAPIFYDSNDTSYYLDPNGESNLWRFTAASMTRNAINYLSINSPYSTRAGQSSHYLNGTMGWGTTDFNTIFSNWGSGYIDTWSSPGNAPGGSSHYVGLQGLHYNFQNSSQAYGFQMACAGEANNRFFWRSAWPNIRSWVEMIHSGNIGSYTIPSGGGWYGSGLPGYRWNGYSVSGGEIVFGDGLPNAGQMGILIDGAYVAGENNGYWSMDGSNTWSSRRGWYWDGSYLNFTTNSPISLFTTLRLANGFEIQQGGSNYGVFNSWVRLDGHYGFYSGTNGAHLYPNNNSYGAWKIVGERNGWRGLHFGEGTGITLMMNEGEFGFHREGVGWVGRFTSGTGHFNISGNAATATTATNVAWSGVTSKPAGWLDETNLIQTREPSATAFPSGFYQSYLGSGNPTGTWFNFINVRHSNPGNGHGYQIGMSYYDSNLWFRSYQGGTSPTFAGWSRALGTQTDPYPSNMNQYVRTFDSVTFGGATLNGQVYISRHIDANTAWGNCGCTTIFVGWSTGKVILGNGDTGGHDWSNDRPSNSIVSTMNHYFYNNIYAREDIVAFWSDARLKTNVKPIENALEKINKIGGYFYTPNQLALDIDATKDTSERVGVMAQEIEEVLPHVVKPAPFNKNYKTVQYEKLVPLLIQAIKEQQKQIEELKAKLA